jgi:putative acetyltransferase
MIIEEESPTLPACLFLLDKSVVYTHSLYEEDSYHNYDLSKISKFFLALHDGIAVGCGAYSWVGEYIIEIKHIFLDENSRGLGGGKLLMVYIEEHAANAGAEQIILETTLKQKEAIGLYIKLGYIFIEPYKVPKHDEQVFMTKFL